MTVDMRFYVVGKTFAELDAKARSVIAGFVGDEPLMEFDIEAIAEMALPGVIVTWRGDVNAWSPRKPMAALWSEVHDVKDSDVLQSHSALSLLEHLRSIT